MTMFKKESLGVVVSIEGSDDLVERYLVKVGYVPFVAPIVEEVAPAPKKVKKAAKKSK